MSFFDADSGIKFAMTVRSERPVEGCENFPHASVFIKGGAMDNGTRAKMMEANQHYFTLSWRRGPRKPMCQNTNCPRKETFEPVDWSRFSLGGPLLQCAICEKSGIPKYDSLFCSKSCFQSAWKEHCVTKHTLTNQDGRSKDQRDDTDISPIEEETSDFTPAVIATAVVDDAEQHQWPEICTETSYSPVAEDVGCVLRIEVRAISVVGGGVLSGPIVIFTEPVLSAPRAPPKRQLLPIAGPTSGGGIRFRVISYNILAEVYATKQAYPYCDSWSLSWPYRLSMLIQELDEAQGDIVCLQEVQTDHFEQHLNPLMQERGYDGILKQKTRESMGKYGKVDGCATFWKRSKFIMSEQYSIEFNETARQTAHELGLDETDYRRYMNRLLRDNVAQIVLLEAVSRSSVRTPRQASQVCIANTHVYSNHRHPDVKMWQTMVLMRELEQFVLQRDVALIVCGDFNSEPESAVYEYLVDGSINQPRPELENPDSLPILPETHNISHSIELASAMETAIGVEPQFTNFTAQFRGTLDYIYFTPGRLRVMAVLPIPNAEELQADSGAGLPSATYPSDHIMLCTDIAFAVSGTGAVARPQQQQRKQSMLSMMGGGSGGGGNAGGGSQQSQQASTTSTKSSRRSGSAR